MTALQEKELELLQIFVQICKQLQLRYYCVCGTALGAVKYQGFIPWDDDVDVALPRDDYNIFLEKAPALLPEYLFLQNYKTDPAYPNIYCKLRDSRTTFIEKSVADLPINHGIYIDIFPLDGYPHAHYKQNILEFHKKRYSHMLSSSFTEPPRSKKSAYIYHLLRFLRVHKATQKVAKAYEKRISSHPIEGSDLICNHGNWQGKLEYAPKEQYGMGTDAVFEGLKVRVPEKYDAYLTQKYGDWRADLPLSQQVGHHYCTVCDLEKPYTEYTQRSS